MRNINSFYLEDQIAVEIRILQEKIVSLKIKKKKINSFYLEYRIVLEIPFL